MQLSMIIDIVIAAVLLAALITGAVTGLVRQLGTMVAFVVAVLACRFFGPALCAALVSPESDHLYLLTVLCYALVFVLAFIAVLLIARLLHATVKAMSLGAVNRILGALFRLALWLVVMSACLNVYFAICPGDRPRFCNPSRPWRAMVVKAAPAVLGFIEMHSNQGH